LTAPPNCCHRQHLAKTSSKFSPQFRKKGCSLRSGPSKNDADDSTAGEQARGDDGKYHNKNAIFI